MTLNIPFTKMAGTGNDFLLIDCRRSALPGLGRRWPRVARTLCDRRHGVGADGLLVLERSAVAVVRMRIFNADGSEAEMCGNGARCAARYALGSRRAGRVVLETGAGVLSAHVRGARVTIRMPVPTELRLGRRLRVGARRLELDSVNTGVPHAVVRVGNLEAVNVQALGRQLRRHPAFQPKGTNVDFIQPDSAAGTRLRIRTYERGVEGETLACGTGVTAAAVVHALRCHRAGSRASTIEVRTAGGDTLRVRMMIAGTDGAAQVRDVRLSGSVRLICRGTCVWAPSSLPRRTRGGKE